MPVIGITTYGAQEKSIITEGIDRFFGVPSVYVEAVRRAGATAILLPPGDNPQDYVELCDGFIFTGGADIDPKYYAGNPDHPKLGPIEPERDAFEFAFLKILMAQTKPILLICRGLQLLNIAKGGNLHAHIAEVHPENIHQGKDTIWTLQEVETTDGRTLRGMSGHHQGIKDLGADLQVDALAKDGIVEAISLASHPYCRAVQWHPEMTAAADPEQQAIFDAFVKEAGRDA